MSRNMDKHRMFRLLSIQPTNHWWFDLIYLDIGGCFDFRIFDISLNKEVAGWSLFSFIYNKGIFVGLEILGYGVAFYKGQFLNLGFSKPLSNTLQVK